MPQCQILRSEDVTLCAVATTSAESSSLDNQTAYPNSLAQERHVRLSFELSRFIRHIQCSDLLPVKIVAY